jgi:NAD(P)-dependent dehydrogenase (short-subunit alcohol dehydrogenase family)
MGTAMAAKRLLITGGCSGLGRALAERNIVDGHDVTVADIASKAHAPLHCRHVQFDCEHPAFEWLNNVAPFDIVICNAGISNSDDFVGTSGELDSRLMQINALGHIALVRELLKKEKIVKGGRLAFVISASQFLPFPIAISYAASKAALDGFAHAVAPYVFSRGISVTRVYPGPMKTPHAAKYYARFDTGKGGDPKSVAARVNRGISARRRRVLPDNAALLFWLASLAFPALLGYFVRRKYCAGAS